jgi:hypothetical protein
MRPLLLVGRLLIACIASSGGVALAVPIDGEMNIAGSVRLSDDGLDFQNPTGGTTGGFVTVQAGTGYFSTIASTNLASPYLGVVKDLAAGASNVTEFLSGFTAPGYAGLTVDLGQIIAPSAAACTGAEGSNSSCSLGYLTVTNLGGGSVALAMLVQGSARDSAVADSFALLSGRFTTQRGGTIGDLMTALAGDGIDAAYSANFEAAQAAEPGLLMLLGVALAASGLVRRRER